MSDDGDHDDDDVYTESRPRRPKRRKTSASNAPKTALVDVFQHVAVDGGFESVMDALLAEYLEARRTSSLRSAVVSLADDIAGAWGKQEAGQLLRPLSRLETSGIIAAAKQQPTTARLPSFPERIALRTLQLSQERRRARLRTLPPLTVNTPTTPSPLDVSSSVPPPQAVLDALRAIKSTPYEHSFAARLYGHTQPKPPALITVDWESRPPWTLLIRDIYAHHALAHPERDQPERRRLPITYTFLHPSHLCQAHDILARVFWEGIDVTDTLHDAPERCSVIAAYGHLVVGVALLSSPQETYITYLAVRAGWENAQIATNMLYHLIALHPFRDITLHVSANNPAMLLYNRFGFKAEEFIAGFYDAYLDTHTKASKNAFRLRLRR